MMIQVFLSALLAVVAAMIGLQRTTSRLVRLSVLVVIAVGAYFVWDPERSSLLAESLGVGRGADLVLYLWVVLSLTLIVFLYLKIVRLSRKLTQLTRAVALAHPQTPDNAGESS